MAKTKRAFFGSNSYAMSVEVAESETGNWFQRSYGYNGYGKQWGKWLPFIPSWSLTYTNVYSLEVTEREAPALEFGFKILAEYTSVPKFRLPA